MGKRICAVIAALACAVVTATGCATQIAGVAQPVAGTASTTTATTASSELGDPRTVDVCQFTDQAAVKALAPKVTLQPSVTAFGMCFFTLLTYDGSAKLNGAYVLSVQTQTGMSSPAAYQKHYKVAVTPKQVDGRTVYSGQADTGCLRGITLSDDQAIVLKAKPTASHPNADPCPAADAMVTGALAVLKAGNLKHKPFPAGSAGDIDLCPTLSPLVSKEALDGFVTPSPNTFFSCDWENSTHSAVSVLVSSDTWPPQFKPGTPQPLRVGNRDGLVTTVDNATLASTYVQVKYTDSPYTKGQFEVVTLTMAVIGIPDVTAQAKQVAADVLTVLDAHR